MVLTFFDSKTFKQFHPFPDDYHPVLCQSPPKKTTWGHSYNPSIVASINHIQYIYICVYHILSGNIIYHHLSIYLSNDLSISSYLSINKWVCMKMVPPFYGPWYWEWLLAFWTYQTRYTIDDIPLYPIKLPKEHDYRRINPLKMTIPDFPQTLNPRFIYQVYPILSVSSPVSHVFVVQPFSNTWVTNVDLHEGQLDYTMVSIDLGNES